MISAAAVFSIATAAQADELSDLKTQSEQIREQNQVLAKQVVELEKRLHKLETQPAKHLIVAARPANPASPPAPAVGSYNKAPSPAADDDSLTWHGITLYGLVDAGLSYQNHGAPLSNASGFGLNYLIPGSTWIAGRVEKSHQALPLIILEEVPAHRQSECAYQRDDG